MRTCVNVSFMLLQSVLALKSFAAALCFTDEPGVSFTSFLMLFKAVNMNAEEEEEEDRTQSDCVFKEINGMCPCVHCNVNRL